MLSQEEITNKQIKEQKIKCRYQLILKTIVMVLFFYIMISPVTQKIISNIKILNTKIGINLYMSILFGIFYFILHIMFI